MNTEQLKTAEQILKENLKNIHFQQADSTFHDVISSMQIFAFQESKRAVSEFKENLRKEYNDRSEFARKTMENLPTGWPSTKMTLEAIISEYRYLIDKL